MCKRMRRTRMECIRVKEAATEWDINGRMVNYHCVQTETGSLKAYGK